MEDLLQRVLKSSQKGKNYAFATVVEASDKGTPRKAGAKMVVFQDGTLYGTTGGGADAGYGFLATTDGNQPKVRPIAPYVSKDGEVLLAKINHTRSIQQIEKTP